MTSRKEPIMTTWKCKIKVTKLVEDATEAKNNLPYIKEEIVRIKSESINTESIKKLTDILCNRYDKNVLNNEMLVEIIEIQICQ